MRSLRTAVAIAVRVLVPLASLGLVALTALVLAVTTASLAATEGQQVRGLRPHPVWSVEPVSYSGYLGVTVAGVGDVDCDGFGEVLVGVPHSDYNHSLEGRAFLYPGSPSGPALEPTWRAGSNLDFGEFGSSIAGAGDVNGDGYPDVIVGAFLATVDDFFGKSYLYQGSPYGLSEGPAWTADGEDPSGSFGASVASAGDVNGDGYADVIIGAANSGELTFPYRQGKAYLFLGSARGLSPTPAWKRYGEQGAQFGVSVASAGDVNHDGYADVIVGASGFVGRAYVFMGSRDGLPDTPSLTLQSDQDESKFGISVASAGDVNNDGYADVIVGATGYFSNDLRHGKAFLYLGSAAGLDPNPAWTATGTYRSAFGYSVASAGDVNGDGFADVIIGAPGTSSDPPVSRAYGQASLYLGSAAGLETEPAWTDHGDSPLAEFGWKVGTAGDVNGDGRDDVIVAASYVNTLTGGRAYVYLGCGSNCSGENASPVCDAAVPSVAEVWPPNHHLVPISILGVTDPDGDEVSIRITGITQNEPPPDAGGGGSCPQAEGVGVSTAMVRAERRTRGEGRVYNIAFTAYDGQGGQCDGTVQVCVPHDHGISGGTCSGGVPTYDSTLCAAPDRPNLVVNSTEDDYDLLAGDGHCATASGVCTLRAAIGESNARKGSDRIVFDLPAGSAITLRHGELAVRDTVGALTIEGPGRAELALDANADSRLILIAASTTLNLSGLTLRNGLMEIGFPDFGSGVKNFGTLNLVDCTLSGNATDSGGGALVNSGTARLDRTVVSGNYADFGGGILNQGSLELVECVVSGNVAATKGGGIENASGSAVLTRTLVEDNHTETGGGISSSGQLEVRDCSVQGNEGFNGAGGIDSRGKALILRTTVSGNFTSSDGGAGGITNHGEMTLVNATVSGNLGDDTAGGILNYGWFTSVAPTIHMFNTTVTDNTSSYGVAGVYNFAGGPIFFSNSLVAGNHGHPENGGVDCGYYSSHSFVSEDLDAGDLGFNLFGEGTGCFVGPTDVTIDPAALSGMLGPLQDNGGSTRTHALLPASGNLAIDGGNPAGCTDSEGQLLTTDQRLEPRPSTPGGRCDIGAYELEGPGLTLPRPRARRPAPGHTGVTTDR